MIHDGQAAMNTDGKVGWEEIVDPNLGGKFDDQELNDVAALAYKCVNVVSKKRPSMRDNVQVLSRILKQRHGRNHHKHSLSATADELTINMDQLERRSKLTQHQRDGSMDSSIADSCEL